jgi:2-(1,2-epoxy-1,2-dihydrophenyl)acetyl-CoA isomerase
MDEPVRLEMTDGIARLTLNRPEVFNAFDLDMLRLLSDSLIELAVDPHVTGVALTGEGKAFCAGGDLKWVSRLEKGHGQAFHALAAKYHQAIVEVRRMPKPVVAAINGPAAGGGFSMALACDFRVMAASAVLRQAYTTNGLSIDGGGTFTLPRLVGLAKAMEIATFDHPISAHQALSWGLVTEVVEDGQAMSRAIQMLQEAKKVPLSSFGAAKKLLNDSFNSALENQLEHEREFLMLCADHPAGHEGIAAFVEKRKPKFF